jgi:hypothetical protein
VGFFELFGVHNILVTVRHSDAILWGAGLERQPTARSEQTVN